MGAATRSVAFGIFVAVMCQAQVNAELKSLYDSHKWKELSDRLQNTSGMPLYRGAMGVTFNQDPEGSERLLLSIIRSAPRSSQGYEAYEWLSHLYFYRGRYRSLVFTMEKRWAAFPEKKSHKSKQLSRVFAGCQIR